MAALLVCLLVGCSGGGTSDTASQDAPGSPATTKPAPSDRPDLPGKAAGGDLSGFICGPANDGDWKATGVLRSPSARSDYRVTVVVAADGTDRTKARRKVIPKVQKGKPKDFRIKNVPAPGDGGTCRVQVVRLG